MEVLSFEHLGHRKLTHEFGYLAERKLAEPFTIIVNFHLVAADYLEELFLVFLSVFKHLFVAEARAGLVAAARVTNLGGIVTHDEHDGMAQVLELAELAHHDRMTEMDIRSGGVHAHLDAERNAGIVGLLELLFKFILRHNVDNAAHQNFELFFNRAELHKVSFVFFQSGNIENLTIITI